MQETMRRDYLDYAMAVITGRERVVASTSRKLDLWHKKPGRACSIATATPNEAGGDASSQSAGATGAEVVAASSEDDDGGGDADPDGRQFRISPRRTLLPSPAHVSSAHPKPARLLRLPEVKTRCGLSRSTIYQRIKNGTFPPALSIGARSVAWIESDIDGWIADQVRSALTLA